MSGFFKEARAALATELEKFRNRPFLEATMAASALVAAADGEVNITELDMIDQALEAIHELNIYDPHDAVNIYRDYADQLSKNPQATRDKALNAVSKIADDKQAAQLLIKVCVAIGRSDENFSVEEKAVVTAICHTLALDSGELGL